MLHPHPHFFSKIYSLTRNLLPFYSLTLPHAQQKKGRYPPAPALILTHQSLMTKIIS